MKNFLIFFLLILGSTCTKESLFDDDTKINLWLSHEGADMPITIEGNTNSKTFLIFLHGGPGGSSQVFNTYFTPFSDKIEKDHAVVYWDQRNSGLSRGEWNPEKITLEQHIEDLDQVIELIKFKFGDDSTLFLAGHSWGAYLGQAYLMNPQRQAKVNAWINIDGLSNRNQNIKDALIKIRELANEQIAIQIETEDWTTLLLQVQTEIDKNIQIYDRETENIIFSFIRRAENIVFESNILTFDFGSSFQSTYRNNAHPFLLSANKRTLSLMIPQMYEFDTTLDLRLSNISIPSLFLYGKFDVRTPALQADYVMNLISTDDADKDLVILETSDHSSIGNQPEILAQEIISWMERYR